ncbi:MFS transporter [Armatimonas rosea]|uniref:MFS family permease n=1 Tax=Armatimonas rosea TaxID=685828 RepID=A0A7W9SLV7_ARMRO|nr:MFS transporter [Armatimonas rosea]MBB6049041.1 MFS family permease [Armatimonas rosea]
MRRFFYGWIVLWVAALAMVGTLPGRTQGLGLITEPLLKDFGLERVAYANLNLWATLIGSLFCLGIGTLLDKLGSRAVLTALALLLGATVIAMGQSTQVALLFVFLVLIRGLGQSALSVVSLAMVGQWFTTGLEKAMATYTVVMTIGFMAAFPGVGAVIEKSGWRVAWSGIGWALVLVLAPLALLLVRRAPVEHDAQESPLPVGGATLAEALRTPAFWVMGLSSALYGLIASGIGLFNESVLKELGFAANVYHTTLAITALTGLVGNFLGGFLATKLPLNRLMAIAMLLLTVGLAALPLARSMGLVLGISVLLGVAGGFVMVLFFSFWAHAFGRAHLGKIQGAAQLLTVLASALGPVLLAEVYQRTGSYGSIFYLLAGVVGVLGGLCWTTKTAGF